MFFLEISGFTDICEVLPSWNGSNTRISRTTYRNTSTFERRWMSCAQPKWQSEMEFLWRCSDFCTNGWRLTSFFLTKSMPHLSAVIRLPTARGRERKTNHNLLDPAGYICYNTDVVGADRDQSVSGHYPQQCAGWHSAARRLGHNQFRTKCPRLLFLCASRLLCSQRANRGDEAVFEPKLTCRTQKFELV